MISAHFTSVKYDWGLMEACGFNSAEMKSCGVFLADCEVASQCFCHYIVKFKSNEGFKLKLQSLSQTACCVGHGSFVLLSVLMLQIFTAINMYIVSFYITESKTLSPFLLSVHWLNELLHLYCAKLTRRRSGWMVLYILQVQECQSSIQGVIHLRGQVKATKAFWCRLQKDVFVCETIVKFYHKK